MSKRYKDTGWLKEISDHLSIVIHDKGLLERIGPENLIVSNGSIIVMP